MSNVVSAPDAIQPATIDFNDLMSKAMAHPAGNDTGDAPPAVLTPSPAAAVPESVSPTPAPVAAPVTPPAPTEQKILELTEGAVVRAKIDGKEALIPVSDFRDGISREAVFTKRMQSLAEQRREAETQLAAEYAKLQMEKQALELAKSQFAAPPAHQPPAPVAQTPAPDLDDIATLGDVQATIQAEIQKIQAQAQEREQALLRAMGEAGQQVQAEAEQRANAAAYTQGLKSVLGKPEYAVLTKMLPYAEESLRYQVAAMDPKSIEEAVQLSETVAKGWLDTIRTEMMVTAQRQEVAKAQAKLEPPQGSAPPPAPAYKPGSAFDKSGKFNWDALRARAEALMG